MQPTDSTIRKLGNLQIRLHDEFAHLPAELVDRELGLVAAALLAEATFDDFVPLLTDRRVRERLAAATA